MTKEKLIDGFDNALQNGYIRVYYQPQYNQVTGKMIGAEALMRWQDPDEGPQYPSDFIPALEESGRIYDADLYVFAQICKFLRTSFDEKIPAVPISFNVSRYDIGHHDYVDEIERIRKEYGIPVRYLRAEITESSAIGGIDLVNSFLERLHACGYIVEMDDFGNGYSSLNVLKDLAVDVIKLDMRFLSGEIGSRGGMIINSIIQMSKWLKTPLIAEGVETVSQAEYIKSMGCRYIQGYLFAKPMSEQQFVNLLQSGEIEHNGVKAEETDLADVYRFLDPDSVETAFFNKYAGPAVICTYKDGAIETLRANARFFAELNIDEADDRWLRPWDAASDAYIRAVESAVCSGAETFCETAYRTMEEHGNDCTLWLMNRISKIGEINGRHVLYITVANITNDKQRAESDAVMFMQIAKALSKDFIHLYYLNIETEEFKEYTQSGNSFTLKRQGGDFFRKSREDARRVIHPEDYPAFSAGFQKERLLEFLLKKTVYTSTYRMRSGDGYIYVSMKATMMDGRHIVIGVADIDEHMRNSLAVRDMEDERTAYARVFALAGNFICIYVVNRDGSYTRFEASDRYGKVYTPEKGTDFYRDAADNSRLVVHPHDLNRVLALLTKSNIEREVGDHGSYAVEYRLMFQGVSKYIRLKATKIRDREGEHILIGLVDIDTDVRQRLDMNSAIVSAEHKAHVDALTGVRNKYAYIEREEELNLDIRNGKAEFALMVFDVNGLKQVNDTKGHQAGDAFLKSACAVICSVCNDDSVYRVGGDEFAAVLQGDAYLRRKQICEEVTSRNIANAAAGDVTVAFGISVYNGESYVSDVFEKADKNMYTHKRRTKASRHGSPSAHQEFPRVTA